MPVGIVLIQSYWLIGTLGAWVLASVLKIQTQTTCTRIQTRDLQYILRIQTRDLQYILSNIFLWDKYRLCIPQSTVHYYYLPQTLHTGHKVSKYLSYPERTEAKRIWHQRFNSYQMHFNSQYKLLKLTLMILISRLSFKNAVKFSDILSHSTAAIWIPDKAWNVELAWKKE